MPVPVPLFGGAGAAGGQTGQLGGRMLDVAARQGISKFNKLKK